MASLYKFIWFNHWALSPKKVLLSFSPQSLHSSYICLRNMLVFLYWYSYDIDGVEEITFSYLVKEEDWDFSVKVLEPQGYGSLRNIFSMDFGCFPWLIWLLVWGKSTKLCHPLWYTTRLQPKLLWLKWFWSNPCGAKWHWCGAEFEKWLQPISMLSAPEF